MSDPSLTLAEPLVEKAVHRSACCKDKVLSCLSLLIGLGFAVSLVTHTHGGVGQDLASQETAIAIAGEYRQPARAQKFLQPARVSQFLTFGRPSQSVQPVRTQQYMQPPAALPNMQPASASAIVSATAGASAVAEAPAFAGTAPALTPSYEPETLSESVVRPIDLNFYGGPFNQALDEGARSLYDSLPETVSQKESTENHVRMKNPETMRPLMNKLLSSRTSTLERNKEFTALQELRRSDAPWAQLQYFSELDDMLSMVDSVKDNVLCKLRLPIPLPSLRTKLGSLRRLLNLVTTDSNDPMQRKKGMLIILGELCTSQGGIRALEAQALRDPDKVANMAKMLKEWVGPL